MIDDVFKFGILEVFDEHLWTLVLWILLGELLRSNTLMVNDLRLYRFHDQVLNVMLNLWERFEHFEHTVKLCCREVRCMICVFLRAHDFLILFVQCKDKIKSEQCCKCTMYIPTWLFNTFHTKELHFLHSVDAPTSSFIHTNLLPL